MGILNVARFETLEVSAKQKTAAASWAAKAGAEKALAMLLEKPTLLGSIETFKLPTNGGTVVDAEIQVKDKMIIIDAVASVGGISQTQQIVFSIDQLTKRIESRR